MSSFLMKNKTKMSNQMTSFRGNENAGYQKMVSKALQSLCVCQSNKQIKVSHSKETSATQILLYNKDSRYPTYHQNQSYPPKCKQTFNSLTIPAEQLTRPKILERAKHLLQIRSSWLFCSVPSFSATNPTAA